MHIRRLLAVALAVVGASVCVSSAQATATVTYVGSYGFAGPAGLYAYGLDYDQSDNTILVGDYWNYRVQRFTAAGVHVATYPDVTGPKANGGIPSAPYVSFRAGLFCPARHIHATNICTKYRWPDTGADHRSYWRRPEWREDCSD